MNSDGNPLLQNMQAFIAFARNRVGDPHLAEDLVQESLLKALEASKKPETDEQMVAWFYRILRRTIIDLYRRRDARKRALERFAQEFPEEPPPEDERWLCQCFKRLLPDIPAQYRELIQQLDLEGREPAQVASELGLTRNNLTVRHHRARKHLKELLAQTCRTCSRHGCLDCTCQEAGNGCAE